jgi:hypothetical protein
MNIRGKNREYQTSSYRSQERKVATSSKNRCPSAKNGDGMRKPLTTNRRYRSETNE